MLGWLSNRVEKAKNAASGFFGKMWNHVTSVQTWVSAGTMLGIVAGAGYLGQNYAGPGSDLLKGMAGVFNMQDASFAQWAMKTGSMVLIGAPIAATIHTAFNSAKTSTETHASHTPAPGGKPAPRQQLGQEQQLYTAYNTPGPEVEVPSFPAGVGGKTPQQPYVR